MNRLGALLLAALVMLPPIAHAASGSGSFLVKGPVELPGGEVSFSPLLVLNNGTEGLGDVEASMPGVKVVCYEIWWKQVRIGPAPALHMDDDDGPTPRVYDLTNATLRRIKDPYNGYLAILPGESSSARLEASTAFALEAKEHSEVATAQIIAPKSRTEDNPQETYWYAANVDEPHVYARMPGAIHYQGKGAAKLMGGAYALSSDQGAWEFETGIFVEPGLGVDRVVYRWLVLESDNFTMDVESSTPWDLAASAMDAGWEGVGSFHALEGDFQTPSASYSPSGGHAKLEGTFTSRLAPEIHRGVAYGRLALEGDVVATTLRSAARSPATLSAPSQSLILLGIVAMATVTTLGFAGGALYHRRARPVPVLAAPRPIAIPAAAPALPFTAEDCCDAGTKAASEEDWAGAAKWFARARALAPTSARICGDLAFASSQIGDVDEALRLYGIASRMSTDGEADFNGALAALHAARPLDEIEGWLERALERTPALVLSLDADDDFRILEGRPRYEKAVRDAWERIGA